MNHKSVIFTGALALAVIALTVVLAGRVLVHSFDEIEMAQTREKGAQVVHAFDADLAQMALTARDYAQWDEAQRYIVDRNQAFLDGNFSFESMNGLHVDRVWIVRLDGTELYSARIDERAHTLALPATYRLGELLRPYGRDIASLHESVPTARLIRTPKGLMALAAWEISRSDKTQTTGVILCFARYITEDALQRVRRTSRLPLTVALVDAQNALPAGLPSAQEHPPAGEEAPIYVRTLDPAHLAAYALMRDLNGKPIALFTSVADRNIGALGRRTTWSLLGTVGALILIFGGAVLVLVVRLQRSWSAYAAAERRQRNILSHLDEIIVLADAKSGRIIEVNDALLRHLGYTNSEVRGRALKDIYVDFEQLDPRIESTDAAAIRVCRMRAKDGRLVDAEITVTEILEDERRISCIVGRDLTLRQQIDRQRHDNLRKLAHLAEHDALTGLPNRLFLQSRLPKVLGKIARTDQLLALLYVDIDNFKNINDSRGHAVGDQLLRIVAKRLRACVASQDVVVRMGGDEFVVIAPLLPDIAAIQHLAQRILATMQAPIVLDDATLSICVSIGIGVYPLDSIDAESLLKHADIALYQAKEGGRNGFKLFASDMNVQLSEHVVLEQALRRALGSGELFVEYQPIVDLCSGRLVSLEALARWQHPELGLIPPARFIPVAEKSGLIVQLGEQVMRQVIGQLQAWQSAGVPLAPIAINVAPVQFERTAFPMIVHELALKSGVDPKWLSFEITESAWLRDSNKHIVMIDTLRHAGSSISIDDFGTGFSNLSYLKHLPVDTIKIDRAFITAITTDPSDAAIVRSIISMANTLRLKTVAEGVETEEQLQMLRELGCVYGQGFYFSRPITADRCRSLLEQLGESRQLTDTVKMRAFKTG